MKESKRSAAAPPRNQFVSKNRSKPPDQLPQTHHVVPPKSAVPKHRQCPICYGGKGGKGVEKWWRRVSGTMVKRCYKCDQCGFDWTVDVRTHTEVLKIEYQEIEVQHHDDLDLETR